MTLPYLIPPYDPTDNPIVVSIKCLVYNHAPYLRACFDSFLAQRTTFAFEVVINDDCSTDGSTEIVREYVARYPHIFRAIYHEENSYKKYGTLYYSDFLPRQAAKGKYIAQCEGDDYWCDPLKLQRQVDYLEAHPDCGLVYGQALFYEQAEGRFHRRIWGGPQMTWEDLMYANPIVTCTTLYRAEYEGSTYFKEIQRPYYNQTDICLWLYIAMQTKIHFMARVMGVRRMLSQSASHHIDPVKQIKFMTGKIPIKTALCRYFDKPYKKEYDQAIYHANFFYATQAGRKDLMKEAYQNLARPSWVERLKLLSTTVPPAFKWVQRLSRQKGNKAKARQLSAPIDFVLYWVDGNDPQWQAKRRRAKGENETFDEARFRDWDLLKFWFRSVEQYAPWVNHIYLVTDAQCPSWLNTLHPKLTVVDHKELIPEAYLPTFNSHTIELHLHKIKGLSEQFVVFNDDTFINAPISPDYYFRKYLPCAAPLESPTRFNKYSSIDKWGIGIVLYCNVSALNRHFDRRKVVRENWRNWLGTYLGAKFWLLAVMTSVLPRGHFHQFLTRHNEKPFLKSVCEEAWEKERELLEMSCTPFRENVQLNNYFLHYWHLASNRFARSSNFKRMKMLSLERENLTTIRKILLSPQSTRITSLCLNDVPMISEDDYIYMKHELREIFEQKLPETSSFEL